MKLKYINEYLMKRNSYKEINTYSKTKILKIFTAIYSESFWIKTL